MFEVKHSWVIDIPLYLHKTYWHFEYCLLFLRGCITLSMLWNLYLRKEFAFLIWENSWALFLPDLFTRPYVRWMWLYMNRFTCIFKYSLQEIINILSKCNSYVITGTSLVILKIWLLNYRGFLTICFVF